MEKTHTHWVGCFAFEQPYINAHTHTNTNSWNGIYIEAAFIKPEGNFTASVLRSTSHRLRRILVNKKWANENSDNSEPKNYIMDSRRRNPHRVNQLKYKIIMIFEAMSTVFFFFWCWFLIKITTFASIYQIMDSKNGYTQDITVSIRKRWESTDWLETENDFYLN